MTDIFNKNTASTAGVMFFCKEIKHENTLYKLSIWDTAGQERFRSISSLYYKEANAVILVCDASEPDIMMNGLTYWSNELKEKCPERMPVICICGNKTDLIPLNQFGEIEEKLLDYIQRENYQLVMTSAKTGAGINEVFIKIIESIKHNAQFDLHPRENINKPSMISRRLT